MPPTQLQPFDVTEHIRQRVREVLVASIPDDQMDAMIQAEVKAYFETKDEYGHKKPSRFGLLIQGMV